MKEYAYVRASHFHVIDKHLVVTHSLLYSIHIDYFIGGQVFDLHWNHANCYSYR